MFEKPTLLILGAGASRPYGYPTGAELKSYILQLSRICSGIDRVKNVSFGEGRDILPGILDLARNFISQMSNVPQAKLTIGSFDHHKEFYNAFSRDPSAGSVDTFLYNHKRFSEIGRFYVLFALLLSRYRNELNPMPSTTSQLLTRIGVEGAGAWYSELVRILRHECDTPKALGANNNLRILTFNYDRSLELYLEDNLASTDRHRGGSWRDTVDIYHLYGEMPKDGEIQEQMNYRNLCAIAWNYREGIRLIGDRSQKDEASIRGHFEWAQNVSLIGFGFDTDNLRLLNFPISLSGKKLRYHNHNPDSAAFDRIQNIFEQWTNQAQMNVDRGSQHDGLSGSHPAEMRHTLLDTKCFVRNISESVFTGLLGSY